MSDAATIDWLLDSDPALRWQVERDLCGVSEATWRATRARVATEGFGARLLALQDPDGQWAGGAFFPRDFEFGPPDDPDTGGQPWIATTQSLNSLREWGVESSSLAGTAEKLASNCQWEYGNVLPYWGGEVDCCINGYTLANGTWLGVDVNGLVDWFVEHQMADGGWNCDWVEGATRSSFHSTLNSLKGLLWHEAETGGNDELRTARHRGEEYLLQRRLARRLTTGDPVGPWVTQFAYPPRWVYSALNAADYFRSAALVDDRHPDERLSEAVDLIRAARQPDGAWLQGAKHLGRVWFEVDVAAGEPSKWVTFLALRVLNWWESAT